MHSFYAIGRKKNIGRSWFRSKPREKNVEKLIQLYVFLQAGIDALRTHGAGVSSVREENQIGAEQSYKSEIRKGLSSKSYIYMNDFHI
jgi:hypothetical protein